MEQIKKWFLLENEEDYNAAITRYEQLKRAPKGTEEHKEKMLLVYLIAAYEKGLGDLPDVDPIEIIKIRMRDFGYNATTLAQEYGDKGTVSKVLHYKQSLSLAMIRQFSRLLKIPVALLIKEYPLKKDYANA